MGAYQPRSARLQAEGPGRHRRHHRAITVHSQYIFLREDLPSDHKFRAKNLNIPSKMAVQSMPSDPPLHTNTLFIPIQDNSNLSQPISNVSTPISNKASDSRESPSPHTSLVSSHSSTPEHIHSLSPSLCNSSASSSSTIVQGGTNES